MPMLPTADPSPPSAPKRAPPPVAAEEGEGEVEVEVTAGGVEVVEDGDEAPPSNRMFDTAGRSAPAPAALRTPLPDTQSGQCVDVVEEEEVEVGGVGEEVEVGVDEEDEEEEVEVEEDEVKMEVADELAAVPPPLNRMLETAGRSAPAPAALRTPFPDTQSGQCELVGAGAVEDEVEIIAKVEVEVEGAVEEEEVVVVVAPPPLNKTFETAGRSAPAPAALRTPLPDTQSAHADVVAAAVEVVVGGALRICDTASKRPRGRSGAALAVRRRRSARARRAICTSPVSTQRERVKEEVRTVRFVIVLEVVIVSVERRKKQQVGGSSQSETCAAAIALRNGGRGTQMVTATHECVSTQCMHPTEGSGGAGARAREGGPGAGMAGTPGLARPRLRSRGRVERPGTFQPRRRQIHAQLRCGSTPSLSYRIAQSTASRFFLARPKGQDADQAGGTAQACRGVSYARIRSNKSRYKNHSGPEMHVHAWSDKLPAPDPELELELAENNVPRTSQESPRASAPQLEQDMQIFASFSPLLRRQDAQKKKPPGRSGPAARQTAV
ncbi:hypothetical protein FB451DRAFT_1374381 [Mycena latifolia]|nr:hypothetical protein FB451DRAFT_1374381 [Mycena latifolia]